MKYIIILIFLLSLTNSASSQFSINQQKQVQRYINDFKKSFFYPHEAIDMGEGGMYFLYSRINKYGIIDSVQVFPNQNNTLTKAIIKAGRNDLIKFNKGNPFYLIIPVYCYIKLVKEGVEQGVVIQESFYESLNKVQFPQDIKYYILNPVVNMGYYRLPTDLK
jgi:hypothetical protein